MGVIPFLPRAYGARGPVGTVSCRPGGRVAATALGLAAFVEIGCRDHYDPDTGEEKVTCAEAGAALLFFMYGAALADSLIDAHDRPRLPDTPVATSWTLTARRGGGTLGASWRF